MMEVTVTRRRRRWEWRVCDHNGTLLMQGRERSRPAARYQGYRSLFLLLSIARRPVPLGAADTAARTTPSNSGASRSWTG